MDFNPREVGVEVETARRLCLLTNGYDPLPLVPPPDAQLKGDLLGSKAVLLKGWPRIDYSAADIHQTIQVWQLEHGWFRSNPVPSQTTGIRFPTAIDLDIDHAHVEDVLDALAVDGELVASQGADWLIRCPIRTGGGKKLCILAGRARDVPKGKDVGSAWQSPEQETLARVEVFHGQGQVGASGVHSYRVEWSPQGIFSPAPTFVPAILYSWLEGPTPFDTPLADLPKLTRADLKRIQAVVDDTLKALGWAKLDIEGSQGRHKWSYTLPTDIGFDTAVGELPYEQLYADLRVAMHPIIGEGRNRARGWVFETKRGDRKWLGVHDHETCTNFLPAEARPLTSREREARALEKANELAAAIAKQNRAEPAKSRQRAKPFGDEEMSNE